MQRYVPIALGTLGALAVAALFARQQLQQAQIDQLSVQVKELREEAETDAAPTDGESLLAARRLRRDGGTDAPAWRATAAQREGAAGSGAGQRSPTGAGDWTRQPPEAVHDELLQILGSEDPAVRARVRELVEAAEEERRDERREQRQQRWETRTLDRLATLAQQVSLSQEQQDALFAILTVARDRASEAFRQGRERGDFDGAREQASKVREEAKTEARDLLDAKQYAAFEQMMQEQQRRRRRGGSPRR